MMKPLLLHYYITDRCNARCAFCGIWRGRGGADKRDADAADVAVNLKHARQAGCKFVDFTGGEPLLHPDLPQFLSAAKKLGFITSVTTNCILFEERAKELAGLVDLLHFSINADNAELHDKIRGVKSYHHVIKSVDIALAHKLYPDLLFTYTGDNIGAIDGVYAFAREKKLMLILDPVFSTTGERDDVDKSVHTKAVNFSRRKGVYLNRAHIRLRENGGNDIANRLCRAVSSTVVVLPDNTLALPCYHQRKWNMEIGGKLDELLKSTERKTIADAEGTFPFCKGCHINCYFDPSYQFARGAQSVYRRESMRGKLRYAVRKYVLYRRPSPRSDLILYDFLRGS